jgi:hypothetical protein
MNDDSKLEDLYFDITEYVSEKIKDGHDSLEISALLVRIGLEIYKTTMDQEDFDKMVDFISENRHHINSLSQNTTNIH